MDRCVIDDCKKTAIYPLGTDEAYYCGNHHAWILFTVVRDLHQSKYRSEGEDLGGEGSGYEQAKLLRYDTPDPERQRQYRNGIAYVDSLRGKEHIYLAQLV